MINENEQTLPKVRNFEKHDWFLTATSRRNLPHWELRGSTYFITIRVHADVGKPFLIREFAELTIETLQQNDKIQYELYAFVIMPDHLHLLIKPLLQHKLSDITKKLKGSVAYHLNKKLNRTGKFWQAENFDHLIRDDLGMREKWEYIKNNPVKSKLVQKADEYPYSSFYQKICLES